MTEKFLISRFDCSGRKRLLSNMLLIDPSFPFSIKLYEKIRFLQGFQVNEFDYCYLLSFKKLGRRNSTQIIVLSYYICHLSGWARRTISWCFCVHPCRITLPNSIWAKNGPFLFIQSAGEATSLWTIECSRKNYSLFRPGKNNCAIEVLFFLFFF